MSLRTLSSFIRLSQVILYKGGQQCDYMVQQILAAGGIEYEKKVLPNNSFELFRKGKTNGRKKSD